jgi:hypothetical protein
MKVFLSWSDNTSQKVAQTLYNWLPYVLQAIDPFISSDDINKGERWSDELEEQLKKTSYGIICLTRNNINAAWMNFEAGALSNAIHRARVSPFLFYVERDQVSGPLQQFQYTVYGKEEFINKQEVFKLVSSINLTLEQAQQVPHERLRREFDIWWPELKKNLDGVLTTSEIESIAGFKWLFHREDIISFQSRVECKSVWVIASHAYIDDVVKEIMGQNMARGVVYTYIVPDSQSNQAYVDDFKTSFATNMDKAILQKVPVSDFYSIAASDYTIINPDCSNLYPIKMFLELPIKAIERYWIEVEAEAAVKFVARFRQYASGPSPKSL